MNVMNIDMQPQISMATSRSSNSHSLDRNNLGLLPPDDDDNVSQHSMLINENIENKSIKTSGNDIFDQLNGMTNQVTPPQDTSPMDKGSDGTPNDKIIDSSYITHDGGKFSDDGAEQRTDGTRSGTTSPVGRDYTQRMKKFVPKINADIESIEISKQIQNFKDKNTPNHNTKSSKKDKKSKHRKRKSRHNKSPKLHHKSPKKIYSPHMHSHQPYHSPNKNHHSSPYTQPTSSYDQHIARPELDLNNNTSSQSRNQSVKSKRSDRSSSTRGSKRNSKHDIEQHIVDEQQYDEDMNEDNHKKHRSRRRKSKHTQDYHEEHQDRDRERDRDRRRRRKRRDKDNRKRRHRVEKLTPTGSDTTPYSSQSHTTGTSYTGSPSINDEDDSEYGTRQSYSSSRSHSSHHHRRRKHRRSRNNKDYQDEDESELTQEELDMDRHQIQHQMTAQQQNGHQQHPSGQQQIFYNQQQFQPQFVGYHQQHPSQPIAQHPQIINAQRVQHYQSHSLSHLPQLIGPTGNVSSPHGNHANQYESQQQQPQYIRHQTHNQQQPTYQINYNRPNHPSMHGSSISHGAIDFAIGPNMFPTQVTPPHQHQHQHQQIAHNHNQQQQQPQPQYQTQQAYIQHPNHPSFGQIGQQTNNNNNQQWQQ